MKHFNLFAGAAVLLSSALISSCVDEAYDLDKLDMEMTLVPGISIPVDETLQTIGADGLFNVEGSGITADSNGDYTINMDKVSQTVSVSAGDMMDGSVQDGIRILLPVTGVPEFLKSCKSQYKLHEPKLVFAIDNPLDNEVEMFATAKANGVSVPFSVTVPAGVRNHSVSVTDSEMGRLFCPVPEQIALEDVRFNSKAVTKAADGNLTYSFNIVANADVTLAFEPGSEFEFECEIDLRDLGFTKDMIHINVSKFDVDASICSSVPMTFTASATANGGQTSLVMDTPVEAGSIASPRNSNVILKAETSVAVNDFRPVTVRVKARNDSNETVVLNKGQGVSVSIARFTAVSGVTFTL